MKLRKNLLCAAIFAAAIGASTMAAATTTGVNYTDLWAKSDEPGWGLSINQQSDVLLGTLFIYNTGGQASWYTVQLAFSAFGPNGVLIYTGQLYQTTGPALGQPYDPALLHYRLVGNVSMEFGDASHALFTYTIDGLGATKQIARLTFAPNPITGSYIGSTQDVTYDCTDPARNGEVSTDPGPFTITQESGGLVMHFPTCTVSDAPATQYGQISVVKDANYHCGNGAFGKITFQVLQSEQGGIVGTYTGRDPTCSFRGNIGGMRVLK